MKKFRQKQFGLLSDLADGATVGSVIGSIGAVAYKGLLRNSKIPTKAIVGGGTVLGAALGALYSSAKSYFDDKNRKATVDNRLMKHVVTALIKSGFVPDKDFILDSKLANSLKTKVCIVISRTNGDLKMIVNTVADHRLGEITSDIIKNLPNSSVVTKQLGDKFNNITISSISDASADYGLILSVVEKYIRGHYPVYLVEVG